MSAQYDAYMEELQRKKEELLELPEMLNDAIGGTHQRLEELNSQLESSLKLSKGIDTEIKKSNSLKEKIKDYTVGGLVGAIFGACITFLIGG